MVNWSQLLILCLAWTTGYAFSSSPSTKSRVADEAIQVFAKKYPFGREAVDTSSRYYTWGMPTVDIDGTPMRTRKYKNAGKRLTDITEKQARASFAELAKLYGQDEALEIVKSLPTCLAFNRNNFVRNLKAYSEIFGEEKAKGMVIRNPGLLAVSPVRMSPNGGPFVHTAPYSPKFFFAIRRRQRIRPIKPCFFRTLWHIHGRQAPFCYRHSCSLCRQWWWSQLLAFRFVTRSYRPCRGSKSWHTLNKRWPLRGFV